ncbi:MAG TPA: hypothetical protein PLS69_11260, partial [Terricaulis sp.]|nr:hypothetical protein [Terricaulis sp.]
MAAQIARGWVGRKALNRRGAAQRHVSANLRRKMPEKFLGIPAMKITRTGLLKASPFIALVAGFAVA